MDVAPSPLMIPYKFKLFRSNIPVLNNYLIFYFQFVFLAKIIGN